MLTKDVKKQVMLVFHIIKKDFKLLLRSRSSAIIIILGPIFLILLVSLAFNTSSIYGIKIGVFSETYTPASDSIIDKLKDRELRVIKTDSATSCIEEVKNGKFHMCMILSPDLDVTEELQDEITFHVDYSRINLAWVVLSIVTSKVEEQSSKWSLDLIIEVLSKLEETKTELNSNMQLMKESTANTEKIFSKSDSMSKDLRKMDTHFDVNDIHFGELKSEIDNLLSENNMSEEKVKKLWKEVNNLKSDLVTVDEKFENIQAGVSSVQEGFDSIKDMSSYNKNNLDMLKASIGEISTNIDSLNVKNATSIISPVITSIKPVSSQKTNFDYIASTVIVLVIMFISVLLASTTVMAEKTSKAYFRRYISSANDITFIIATYLAVIIIIILQLVIILSIASLFLNTSFLLPSLFSLSLVLLTLATLFILAGMLIGYVFNSEETSTLAAISFSSVMLFFSNTLLPMENMPGVIRDIAFFNPFVIGQSMVNKILLFQISMDLSMLYLIVYIALLFVALLFVQKGVRKKISGE